MECGCSLNVGCGGSLVLDVVAQWCGMWWLTVLGGGGLMVWEVVAHGCEMRWLIGVGCRILRPCPFKSLKKPETNIK